MTTLQEKPIVARASPAQKQDIVVYEGGANPRLYGYGEVQELYEGEIVIDAEPPTYPGISVSDFLRQTTVYEEQPVPFAPRLRQGAFAGMALTVAGSLSLALLPVVQPLIAGAPILLLQGFLNAYTRWIAGTPLLSYINGVLLGSSLVLLIMTRKLQQGRLPLHWLAFAEAIGGSANLVMLVIPLSIICINFALWIVILVVILLVFALVVVALAALL